MHYFHQYSLAPVFSFLMFVMAFFYNFQTALVQHSIQKELCNAPIVGKLRKVNGYMQVVTVHCLSLAWMTGPMMRIFMI